MQELRPKDSIPFLRRVSADLQKSEAVRFLSQVDMPDTPTVDEHATDETPLHSPPRSPRRRSNSSARPLADNDISPREHTFVKTTFSKRTCPILYSSFIADPNYFNSHGMSRVLVERQEERGALRAVQPYLAFQVRSECAAHLRSSCPTALICSVCPEWEPRKCLL